MQFPTICSPAFLFFILASTRLVASAPLPYNIGGTNIPKRSQVDEPTSKLPADAMPNCEAPNVTTLPPCLASPDVEECTEWMQEAAAECVEFTCPANEPDAATCTAMLQSALASKPQRELAQCYAHKVKEMCTDKAPTALPRTQHVPVLNGRSADIPGPKQPSTREVEYSETPGPEAPGAGIPKAPASAGDTPHVEVETLDTKLPDTKAPKTKAPETTDVDGALKKAPTGVDLLHIPNTDTNKVKPPTRA